MNQGQNEEVTGGGERGDKTTTVCCTMCNEIDQKKKHAHGATSRPNGLGGPSRQHGLEGTLVRIVKMGHGFICTPGATMWR